jgi:hypothetical protein
VKEKASTSIRRPKARKVLARGRKAPARAKRARARARKVLARGRKAPVKARKKLSKQLPPQGGWPKQKAAVGRQIFWSGGCRFLFF